MIEECIFCKIGRHEAEAEMKYEDESFVVFEDIQPSAPVHLLIVPKEHFCWWEKLEQRQKMLGKIFSIAVGVAEEVGIKESGFKLVMNGGEGAGQEIDHFHVHLMGGFNQER